MITNVYVWWNFKDKYDYKEKKKLSQNLINNF